MPDNRIRIFDTTLRDGEQAPGCSMTLSEKLRVARALATRGLDAAGYGCGIDNFGHSFRSLAQLRSLKIRYLKMDGSYTREIDRDAGKQFFVRALCDTAHSIDILVIAGAVETADEAGMIARLYVDGVQGNLYGKPLPV